MYGSVGTEVQPQHKGIILEHRSRNPIVFGISVVLTIFFISLLLSFVSISPATHQPPSQSLSLNKEAQVRIFQTARDSKDRLQQLEDATTDSQRDADVTIELDTETKFQEIIGFGGAFTEAAGYNLFKMSPKKQEEIVSAYFGPPEKSLGYTLGRVHINSCDYSISSYSCDDTPDDYLLKDFQIDHDKLYLLPFIKAALASSPNPIKIFASPWSPPSWMKGNGQMDGSSEPGLKDDPRVHAAWALFLSKFITAYEDEGVHMWGLTVQNEPANNAPWEACVYTPAQERDFIKNFLGPRLRADHPELALMIWDHNRDLVVDWASVILSDPEAAQYVAGTGFHWYTGNSPALNLYSNLDKAHEIAPQKFLLATEATYCPEVHLGEWSRGETYGIDILNDLNHWSSGWTDWNLLLDKSGGPNHLNNMCDAPIVVDPSTDSVFYQPMFWYLGHFSKFIRPKARRISHKLSTGQKCYVRSQAVTDDRWSVCSGIQWAADQLGVPSTDPRRSCSPNVITENANSLFNQWYQLRKDIEGPSACNFAGVAHLEGLQVTAFENDDGTVAAVVLNAGDSEQTFRIGKNQVGVVSTIPGHSIQTLVFDK